MWPFTKKDIKREASFNETQKISRRINDIIFKIDYAKNNIDDSITLGSVNSLQSALNNLMNNVRAKDYNKCLEILNMIEESINDLNPLLGLACSNADMQMEFIKALLADYERGNSIFLDKRFKDIYKKRSELLASNIETRQRIKLREDTRKNLSQRALAAKEKGNEAECRKYYLQIQGINKDISELEMTSQNALNHIDFINMAIYKVLQDRTYDSATEITGIGEKIISDALNNANRNAYKDLALQKKLSEQNRKQQSFINEAISSQDTFVNSNRNVASTNEFSRNAQQEKESKMFENSNSNMTQAELDELNKYAK